MIDQQFINRISEQINAAIPADIKEACSNLDTNLKSVIQGALAKVDMVPREEFDMQCKVLARTRAKLEVLEKKIAELEQTLLK